MRNNSISSFFINRQNNQSLTFSSRIRSWGIYKRYAHNTHAHVIMKPWIEPPESSSSLYTIKNATVPMVVLSVADKTNHHTTTNCNKNASESPDVALTNSSSSKIDPYYSADRDGLEIHLFRLATQQIQHIDGPLSNECCSRAFQNGRRKVILHTR